MDINTDTTPALHAGSAVRANPLHTEYTVHSTFSTLHYKSGEKNKKQTNKNWKQQQQQQTQEQKKPQSISAPQDPTPQNERKKNEHPPQK